MLKTAIVTGANGFIGAHVTRAFLDRGSTVIALGRSKGAANWEGRVRKALSDVPAGANGTGQLLCHEVDLETPAKDLGLAGIAGTEQGSTLLIHIAGDTKFNPPDPGRQHRINVDSAMRIAEAAAGRIARMVHVSTTYVAGQRTGLILESELNCGQTFWNPYEKSKLDAEEAVTDACSRLGIPLVIVRPSVIINDRRTGRASTFTHLNAIVEVIRRIQAHYGISDGEVVNRSVRLRADPMATPNLAPVDSIIEPLVRIALAEAAAGRTFHLCHPEPQPNHEIVDLVCDAIQIKGRLRIEYTQDIVKPMTHTEEMILRSLRVYAPYLNSRCMFGLSNTRELVPDYDAHFTPLDAGAIRRIIEAQEAPE